MFTITFLGTSASVPTVDRGMPSLAVKYGGELMLWDCGEGTQRQLMRYRAGFGSIDAIFITHPHLDHFLGMFGLLETLKLSSVSPKPLTLVTSQKFDAQNYPFVKQTKMRKGKIHSGNGFEISAFPVKHCRGSYGIIFREEDKLKFYEEKAHSLGLKGRMFQEIQKKGKVEAGGRTVRLEDVTWTRPGRKVVYTGDSAPDENTASAAQGADLLIHEGTFDASMEDEARERQHSTVEDAAVIAKKAKVKKLIITHISPRYSDSSMLLKQAQEIFNNTIIASDGLTVEI
ncbi:ribonuclease Z [Candidatus Micrarchaeota archaeon]|nr:ribonuclease Z [Candidatus Micrarchaeota archaeon]